MAKGISGGSVAVAAPRVSAPSVSVGGSKAGPKSFAGGPERGGPGGNVATKFSSRGLEAFRNPAGPQVSIKGGKESTSGAKMRVDSFGKPVSTPAAKAEFSKPGVTGPQRSMDAYAPESAFAKTAAKEVPKNVAPAADIKIGPVVLDAKSLDAPAGGSTAKTTSEQIQALKAQSPEQAYNEVTRLARQSQNKIADASKAKSVEIVWNYKSKAQTQAEKMAVPVSKAAQEVDGGKKAGTIEREVAKSAEISARKVEEPSTQAQAVSQSVAQPKDIEKTTAVKNQEVAVRTFEKPDVENYSASAPKPAESVVTTALKPEIAEPVSVEKAPSVAQPVVASETKSVEPAQNKAEDTVQKAPDIATKAPVNPGGTASEIKATVSDKPEVVAPTPADAVSVVKTEVPKEPPAAPINPAEVVKEVTAAVSKEPQVDMANATEKARKVSQEPQTAPLPEEKSAAFQQDLARIKEQVAELVDKEAYEIAGLKEEENKQTQDRITVLPEAQPLPIPEVVAQPRTTGGEFSNLFIKRQKEKVAVPVTVISPDQQANQNRKDTAVTVKAHRAVSFADIVRAHVVTVSEKAKKGAQNTREFGRYLSINWDEIFKKKGERSAYEEITSKTSTASGGAAIGLQTNNIPNMSAPAESGSLSVTPPAEAALLTAQPLAKPSNAAQEEAIARALPQTKPINTPELAQQLSVDAKQDAGSRLGIGRGPTVIFEEDPQLILDMEAKRARQKAIERSVMNASITSEGTITGPAVVAASEEKHTTPLVSGAAKARGRREDGSEITLWNRIGEIGDELSHKEMVATALQIEEGLRPVVDGDAGNKADEKDLNLVLSNVKKIEVDLAA